MTNKNKPILIGAIMNYLREENKKRNKILCSENLFSEQKAFDEFGVLLSLNSMPEKDFNKIAQMVVPC